MTALSQQFGAYLREQLAALPASEQPTPMNRTLSVIAAAMADREMKPLETYAHDVGTRRATAGHVLRDVVSTFTDIRDSFWGYLNQFLSSTPGWEVADLSSLEEVLHSYRNAFINGFSDTYQDLQRQLSDQAEQLDAQRTVIRQLSTPILPIYEGVIVLPLVGAIDSHRATQVMEALLEAISEQQAEIVILDITGVPMVDTGVANHLLQTARAAQLVGAQVVLVGISSEIAQTIVQLGVDLSRIQVYANLQAGIGFALSQVGRKIS